jgi:hypothetical protein
MLTLTVQMLQLTLTDSGDLVERVDKNNNDIAHGYSQRHGGTLL